MYSCTSGSTGLKNLAAWSVDMMLVMPFARLRSVVQARLSASRNTTPAPPSEVRLPPVKVLMAAWMRSPSFAPSSMKACR